MGAIPEHVLRALPSSGRRALVLRHAERFAVVDLATHEDVLLTEAGHANARVAGAELHAVAPGATLVVGHSPVERCAQTARGVAAGFAGQGGRVRTVGAVAHLASPFVVDKGKAYALVNGFGHRFIRAWFDGEVPEDCFQKRHRAAAEQLDVLVEAVRGCAEDELAVFITHDWNIALMREEFLGVKHEDFGWPGYLDGVSVAVRDDARVRLGVGARFVDVERA
jgi:broad specificity phosphatase PhoE